MSGISTRAETPIFIFGETQARDESSIAPFANLNYHSRMLGNIARFLSCACSFALLISCAASARASTSSQDRSANGQIRRGEHIVIVAWDGMRPDFVSEQNTPTLWKLAREGAIFRNHHAVYPSATMVNCTAMMTGVYPAKSGIIANYVYRPDIDSHHAVAIELPSVLQKGDQLSGGKYISAPTIAELVQRAGARSVIASAKTVGLLLDRQSGVRRDVGDLSSRDEKQQNAAAVKKSVTLSAGLCLPNMALAPITEALGPFPSAHLQKDSWTTKALIELLWKDGLPAF